MARRGTRCDQYFQIAAHYGRELIQAMRDPSVPEFVIVHAARRAGHYGLTALWMQEREQRLLAPRPQLASADHVSPRPHTT